MKRLIPVLAVAACASLASAAPKTVGWTNTVTLGLDGSHILGNPAAQVKVAEYASYTCPHCARFAVESDGPLRIGYIPTGKVSFDVRHMLHDPIDLAAAMLVNCGSKDKFFLNHSAFMRSQSKWIAPLTRASDAQKARWTSGNLGARNRAIAADFKFYDIMATRGYSRIEVDRFLADQSVAKRIGKQAQDGYAAGVRGTPGFTINGRLLDGVHEWSKLRPLIDKSL